MRAKRNFQLKLVAGGALASLVLGLFFVSNLSAYSTKYSHPHFTREAAIFFNYFKPENQLTSEEVGWLVQGAIDEDMPPRYTNHFYDPVYNRGWKGNLTAKDWAQSPEVQSQPVYPKGNQSWEQAIYLYREGKKKEAFIALGHILHLVEDVSVPDHTRNDTHLPFNSMESPFEKWVENYLAQNYEPYANQLIVGGTGLLKLFDLGIIFDELANFSNRNFFSEDSILSEVYSTVKIFEWGLVLDKDGGYECGYTKKILDQKYCVVGRLKNDYSVRNFSQVTEYTIDRELILSDYLSILGPKAVQYSASVIDLFFREIQAEEKLGLENQKPRNFIDALRDKAAEIFNIPQLASKNQPSKVKSAAELSVQADETISPDLSDSLVQLDQSVLSDLSDLSTEPSEPSQPNTPPSAGSGEANKTEPMPLPILFAPQIPPSVPPPNSPPPAPAPAPVYYGGQWAITPLGASVGTNLADTTNKSDETNGTNPDVTVGASGSNPDVTVGASESNESNETNQIEESLPPDTTPPLAPQIVLPTELGEYLTNQPQFALSGAMSTDTARIRISLADEDYNILSFNLPAEWLKDFDFSQKNDGEYLFEVFAYDEAGNKSATSSLKVLLDRQPPEISDFQISKNENNNFELGWFAGEENGDIFYFLEYSLNGGEFLSVSEQPIATPFVFDPPSKKRKDIYKFRLRAKDKAGNIGDWQEVEEELELPHILISEIKISGVGSGESTNEFVELYNPTSGAVSLSDWKLRPFTASGKEKSYLLRPFSDSATIPPFGFYLIAHPSGYKHNTTPDAVYSTKESLASDNGLILYNQDGEITDTVGWGDLSSSSTYESAAATDIPDGFSLERKANVGSTAESMNFNGEDEILGNGFDGDNNANDFILRTNPEPQNSESLAEPRESDLVRPGEVVDLSVIWHKSMSSSLILKFTAPQDANLSETAKYDLRYEKTTIPGLCLLNIDWSRAEKVNLDIAPSAEGTMENIEVVGLKAGEEYCFALKTFNGFAWSELSNTLVAATPKEYKKEGNILQHVTHIPSEINDELILTADQNPYYIGSYVKIKNQGFLKIMPGVVIKFGPPYYSWNYYYPTEILVWGSLEILGTKDDPVILTSIKDDRFYGDTNGDGNSSVPAPDDWGGIRNVSGTDIDGSKITISYSRIYFNNNIILGTSLCGKKTQQISIDHAYFKNTYAGLTLWGDKPWCNTEIADLNNVLVENASGIGLTLNSGARAKIRNSTFRNNGNYGIFLGAVFEDQIDIENSNIYGNGQFDMRNFCGVDLKQTLMVDTSGACPAGYPKQITAKHIFWGSPDGPQKIKGKIDYAEWLSEEAAIEVEGDN